MESSFHACATCIHFQAERTDKRMKYFCRRLGYETRPDYRFNCWSPKEHVKKLIEKREQGN
ncbi:hypothetical protein [Bacillus canaveralius]|uniref:hypothetical protein n=1 Tax=Bacillus canaveralius TaxID=1403243 RepID=UPI000C774238|nr:MULTISPECIES: hypothetical protein [Bacillus]PLR82717.1 hypothetical protein CVD23_16085 [Bacillus sp. V33-4]RSK53762.1 hypothetical protein EJA13_07540 [Bacillus canaveralius]